MSIDPVSSMDWTHEQVLQEVAKLCLSDDRPDCLYVIALWNEKGRFDSQFWNVGLSCSQVIALLEVQKQRQLKLMGEITDEY